MSALEAIDARIEVLTESPFNDYFYNLRDFFNTVEVEEDSEFHNYYLRVGDEFRMKGAAYQIKAVQLVIYPNTQKNSGNRGITGSTNHKDYNSTIKIEAEKVEKES